MIIAKIQGGLGNQMFTYATAFALAKQKDQMLYLDLSTYQNDQFGRKFELDVFDFEYLLATNKLLNAFAVGKNKNLIQKISVEVEKLKPYYKRKVYKEPFFHFDKNIFNTSDDVYLDGYFQTERYFKDFEKDIREVFDLGNIDVSRELFFDTVDNTVAVHIRRGDYITNSTVNDIHGVCSLNYYKKSIEVIKEKIANPKFVFFSDDISWCKENFKDKSFIFNETVDVNNPIKDLKLMSMCKHNIIANSSFSWWGAWLNNNPKKNVVAPKPWFNKSQNYDDITPKDWITIDRA